MIRDFTTCVTDADHEFYSDTRMCRWCGKTDQVVFDQARPSIRRPTDDEIERWVRRDRLVELRKQRTQSVIRTIICGFALGASAAAATVTLWFVPTLVVFLWLARREAKERERLLGEIADLIGPPARAYLPGPGH